MRIDLNCDLGEGFGVWRLGDDEALLAMVTSANVACGFHAGDPQIMASVVRAAAAAGSPSGPRCPTPTCAASAGGRWTCRATSYGGRALPDRRAGRPGRAAGTRVSYVKPHGALYHRIAGDPVQAAAVVAAGSPYGLPLLTLAGRSPPGWPPPPA